MARALNGTCGDTSPFDAGDCSSDDKGFFRLSPAAYASSFGKQHSALRVHTSRFLSPTPQVVRKWVIPETRKVEAWGPGHGKAEP